MLGFEGRHVVPSSTGRRIIFGAFEHSVVVADLVQRTWGATLETTFDFGGQRLALTDEVDAVVAAAYHVHGLALYSCKTGHELWRRKDMKKVQHIALARDGHTAYCGREGASLAIVDLRTGQTKRTVRGARALYDSKYNSVQLLDGGKPQLLDSSGKRLFFVDRTTFAFLDISFAPGLLALSESGGAVRCLDVATGKERWCYQPPSGSHVLRLEHRRTDSSLFGVEWPFVDGGLKRVLRWSLDDGAVTNCMDLGDPSDSCFGLEGDVVVTSEGQVFDTATGVIREWKGT